MQLESYSYLIQNLPYLDHAFETSRAVWQKHFNCSKAFSEYYHKVFYSSTIKFSRLDVFKSCKAGFTEGLFTTIMWGYPRNMRGNNFKKILSSLEADRLQICFPSNKNLSENEFLLLAKKLKSTGIGLSTFSKLLYFFKYEVENKQCLILDSRIIEIINEKNTFKELNALGPITGFNKYKKYAPYLRIMEELADQNQCKPDQIELFLFLLGRNLKTG